MESTSVTFRFSCCDLDCQSFHKTLFSSQEPSGDDSFTSVHDLHSLSSSTSGLFLYICLAFLHPLTLRSADLKSQLFYSWNKRLMKQHFCEFDFEIPSLVRGLRLSGWCHWFVHFFINVLIDALNHELRIDSPSCSDLNQSVNDVVWWCI